MVQNFINTQTINDFIEVMAKAFELSEKIAKGNPCIDRIDWHISITGRNGVNESINERLTEEMKKAGMTV